MSSKRYQQAHALLQPQKAKKEASKSLQDQRKGRDDTKTSPRGSDGKKKDIDLSGSDVTKVALPSYNPRALLNPRGARTQSSQAKSSIIDEVYQSKNEVSNSGGDVTYDGRNSGTKSMLEAFHGLQHRSERPSKRVKVAATNDDEDKKLTSKFNSSRRTKDGIVGKYMRPTEDDARDDLLRDLVDLTKEEDVDNDDDDIKVIKAVNVANEQEVCFGMLHTDVHAHAIPATSGRSQFTLPTQWPVIKCTLKRIVHDDTVIEVTDPEGFIFGRVATDVAKVLAPVMDSMRKLRTQARLTNRPKKPNEAPHQACSARMKMMVNVYGRRGDAEKIGRVFGQHNIWFRNPLGAEVGYPTVNPHVHRAPAVMSSVTNRSSSFTGETRTIEEATQAVSRVFDHFANTAKPLEETETPPLITTPLLQHQKQALTFMLRCEQPRTYGSKEEENSSLWRKKIQGNGRVVFQEVVTGLSVKDEPEQVYGGLLADVMGLGKTLETLSLIASTQQEAADFASQTLSEADRTEFALQAQSGATLIVAPVSTVKNWEDQIAEHVQAGELKIYVYHGSNRAKDPLALSQADIVISTYGTIATECSKKATSLSPIRQIRWFRLVLDEAHTIREPKATQSQAMYSIHAQRRWCLTGTPIQNRIDDLGSLTKFLRLYPYDTAMRFNQYVRGPAVSGDVNFLKALRIFVDSFTLRRLKDRIDLPKRQDLIEKLNFSKEEQKLHDFFKQASRASIEEVGMQQILGGTSPAIQHSQVLRSIMTLRLICAHGRELLKEKDLERLKGQTSTDAIDIETGDELPSITERAAYETLSLMAEAGLDMCRRCDRRITGTALTSHEDDLSENDDDDTDVRAYVLSCQDIICTQCFTESKNSFDCAGKDDELDCPFCSTRMKAKYISIDKSIAEVLDKAPEDTLAEHDRKYTAGVYHGPHTKTKALLRDLRQIQEESSEFVKRGEAPIKSVVFSEFTSHLDLLGRALTDHGHHFTRIDGTMSLSQRKKVLDELNTNPDVTILLASIKAAGQGLNLTAASRAFIMEPLWNPAAEVQAVDRIYRIGQKREVVIKRYQMQNSIELKILELQDKKQRLADLSLNKNHQALSKKDVRAEHMKDLLNLFK